MSLCKIIYKVMQSVTIFLLQIKFQLNFAVVLAGRLFVVTP